VGERRELGWADRVTLCFTQDRGERIKPICQGGHGGGGARLFSTEGMSME